MKKVTSITILTTAEGKRVSLTYSNIDGDGNIVEENKRVNKVVVNSDALSTISELEEFAQGIVESE